MTHESFDSRELASRYFSLIFHALHIKIVYLQYHSNSENK